MKNIYLGILFVLSFLHLSGCGQRIIGNPGKYSYEEYSDFRGYRKEQLKQAETEDSKINPQSVIPNPKLIASPTEDFNKACKRLK